MIVEMEKGFYKSGLPGRMWDGVQLYVLHGKRPGHFLQALFANDLQEVFARVDDENMALMRAWVSFVYLYAPSNAHGSQRHVAEWIARGGLQGGAA